MGKAIDPKGPSLASASAAAGPTSRTARKKASRQTIFQGQTVSRQGVIAAGAHGAATGVWFHVTDVGSKPGLMEQGLKTLNHGVGENKQVATWVDPNAVYLWPSMQAAQQWQEYRRDGGYGRLGDETTVVAVRAGLEESDRFAPDNESLAMSLIYWAGEKDGEDWSWVDDEDTVFHHQTLDVCDGTTTFRDWLDQEGQDAYWQAYEEVEEEHGFPEEKIVAIDLVRQMPASLRKALVEHYSAHGRPIMFMQGISAGRLYDVVD